MKTWNKERKRTRDRLLEYDFNIVPPHPHSAGLSIVYPWENMQLYQLEYQIYTLAQNNGYNGTMEDLWNVFSKYGYIISGTISTFPLPGDTKNIYFDTETGIIYYFKISETINNEALESTGAVATAANDGTFYVYIPVRALLIEDTILNCGDASEYIG